MNDVAVHCRYQVADDGALGRCDIGLLNHPSGASCTTAADT